MGQVWLSLSQDEMLLQKVCWQWPQLRHECCAGNAAARPAGRPRQHRLPRSQHPPPHAACVAAATNVYQFQYQQHDFQCSDGHAVRVNGFCVSNYVAAQTRLAGTSPRAGTTKGARLMVQRPRASICQLIQQNQHQ